MAKSPAGVSGSQFFVTLASTPHLNGEFTVFGRVVDGLEVLEGLTPRDPSKPNQPSGDLILSIEIVEE
jgi:cyclophilin family peptidyl-prolyl cis-trans isomerase